MSNMMDKIQIQDKKSSFKLVMVLAFVLVAISFFAVGFLYAQAPGIELLIKLLGIFGGINIGLIYYLCTKYNGVINT
jgi:predicted membrane protein